MTRSAPAQKSQFLSQESVSFETMSWDSSQLLAMIYIHATLKSFCVFFSSMLLPFCRWMTRSPSVRLSFPKVFFRFSLPRPWAVTACTVTTKPCCYSNLHFGSLQIIHDFVRKAFYERQYISMAIPENCKMGFLSFWLQDMFHITRSPN